MDKITAFEVALAVYRNIDKMFYDTFCNIAEKSDYMEV